MYPLNVAIVIGSRTLSDDVNPVIQSLPVRILLDLPEISDSNSFVSMLESVQPELLLLDTSAKRKAGLDEVIRRLRAALPGMPIVALGETADPLIILEAMRAGAVEFLYVPLRDQLGKLLESVAAERQRAKITQGRQGRVIGCLSAKGGCGASTIACHVAREIPRHTNQETLIVDLDLQTALLGFLMKTKSPYSVLDAASNVHRLDENYWKRLVSNGVPGLEVMSAPAPLTSQTPLRREDLAYVIQFARSQYQWVVADLGRSLTPLVLSGIEAVTDLLLVTTPEVPALHLTKHIIQRLRIDGLREGVLKLVLNRMPKSPEITVNELEDMLGVPAFAVLPNDYPSLNGSYSEGKLLDPNTKLGRSLTDLTFRLAGIAHVKEKKRFKLLGPGSTERNEKSKFKLLG